MSYTRPAASAADTSWQGLPAYTLPAAGAADATFLIGNNATGFSSTTFGAPRGVYTQTGAQAGWVATQPGTPTSKRRQSAGSTGPVASFGQPVVKPIAVGFKATALGTPVVRRTQAATSVTTTVLMGTPTSFLRQRPSGFLGTVFGLANVKPIAVGFKPTLFGRPTPIFNARGFQPTNFGSGAKGIKTQRPTGFNSTQLGVARIFPYGAPGFKPTTFGLAHVKPIAVGFVATRMGSPIGWQHWNAMSLGPVTRFSAAYYAFNQIGAASGFRVTRFGLPGEISYLPLNPAVSCQAFGFTSTAMMGTPSAGWRQTGAVTGWGAAMLGTPTGISTQAASALHATQMGVPRVKLTQRTTGAHPVHFGTATARIILGATGLHNPARFGLPRVERGNTYKAYGFTRAGRFGQPQGFSRFNYQAAGFGVVRFGAPSCAEHHRAAALPPCARFGRALLKRIAQC